MRMLTVPLTIPELVAELSRATDPAVRIQLCQALAKLIADSSVERLGLDGTLSWLTAELDSQLNRAALRPELRARATVGERQVEGSLHPAWSELSATCARRAEEVRAYFAQSQCGRANFVILHELEADETPDVQGANRRAISGQLGFIRFERDAHSTAPVRIVTPNLRDDLRQAIRDAELAALDYLSGLGLPRPHGATHEAGFGLVCELNESELTRGGRSLAAAAFLAIVSCVLSQAGVFAVPRDVVIAGDVAYDEATRKWELRAVDTDAKVRLLDAYYPHVDRFLIAGDSVAQTAGHVEIAPVAGASQLLQTVFGADCEDNFRAAIAQINERMKFGQERRSFVRRARWAMVVPTVLSLVACTVALINLPRSGATQPRADYQNQVRRSSSFGSSNEAAKADASQTHGHTQILRAADAADSIAPSTPRPLPGAPHVMIVAQDAAFPRWVTIDGARNVSVEWKWRNRNHDYGVVWFQQNNNTELNHVVVKPDEARVRLPYRDLHRTAYIMWWVEAWRKGDSQGVKSEPEWFVVNGPPSKPRATAPQTDDILDSRDVLLEWLPSGDEQATANPKVNQPGPAPVRYWVRVQQADTMTTVFDNAQSKTSETSLRVSVPADGRYRWSVTGWDGMEFGETNEVEFTVKTIGVP